MATFGKIDEFTDSDNWTQYIERLNYYFQANDITDGTKKRNILLTVCGSKIYGLIRNLLSPAKPDTKSYDQISKLVEKHLNPKPSVVVRRFRFYNKMRGNGQSVADFVAELRQLSEDCEFGDTLETMLRDRLVCGIADTQIQKRLLQEKELDFKKAFDVAQAMEAAARNTADLQLSGSGSTTVLALQDGPPRQSKAQNSHAKKSFHHDRCYRCESEHDANGCPFKSAKCFKCDKLGHLQKMCRTPISKQGGKQTGRKKKGSRGRPMHQVETATVDTQSSEEHEFNLFTCSERKINPYKVQVNINAVTVVMELDTGASATLINETVYQQINEGQQKPELQESKMVLRSYTGQAVPIVGRFTASVIYQDQTKKLPVTVVKGKQPCLLGRDWLEEIRIDWHEIKHLRSSKLDAVLEKYKEVFEESLGTFHKVEAKIKVVSDAQPRYFKPRPVPYALRDKIEKELERLQSQDIITPVDFSEWAAPIVPVQKSDGSVRICGDYKLTVNRVSLLDNYPIPSLEDLYSKLSGGKFFTKLDLSHAYEQVCLEEGSQKYTTINTHKGLFAYKRLSYGISSAPGIFQRAMEQLLNGLPRVIVRIDDILLSGDTPAENLEILEKVLKKLSDSGVRLKRNKCEFLSGSVVFSGHKIDDQGIHPVETKIKAIQEAPCPCNTTELRSYLGLLNFYGKFIKNLSSLLAPLHHLLQKDIKWKWGEAQQKTFDKTKMLLQLAKVLIHYDEKKELVLACDASPYGVGAVLSHKLEDGSERSFASRTLTPAERNYSQLDKEGLAIVFGVKKFHQYLYGRKFSIITDHKPLLGLFGSKCTPTTISPRVQRWILTLSGYEYSIYHRPGVKHGNADAVSRLPIATTLPDPPVPSEVVHLIEHFDGTTVTSQHIKSWTSRDPVMSKVRLYTSTGWPQEVNDERLKAYKNRQNEISLHDGCVLWEHVFAYHHREERRSFMSCMKCIQVFAK